MNKSIPSVAPAPIIKTVMLAAILRLADRFRSQPPGRKWPTAAAQPDADDPKPTFSINGHCTLFARLDPSSPQFTTLEWMLAKLDLQRPGPIKKFAGNGGLFGAYTKSSTTSTTKYVPVHIWLLLSASVHHLFASQWKPPEPAEPAPASALLLS